LISRRKRATTTRRSGRRPGVARINPVKTSAKARRYPRDLDRAAPMKITRKQADNVLWSENLAAWVGRSWGMPCSGCPVKGAHTGSAVKK